MITLPITFDLNVMLFHSEIEHIMKLNYHKKHMYLRGRDKDRRNVGRVSRKINYIAEETGNADQEYEYRVKRRAHREMTESHKVIPRLPASKVA